ncbi:MAG TPA: protein kinase [Thermoanaerobaculia bacterium]|nr:protein kinase [Thermoanaerobaculia bacterium]
MSRAGLTAVRETGGFSLIGRNLGQYRITAAIGAGGMGEVYRATDARLGREVAIKVLPASVASDPERRKRFEQEARSASALNHPNILTVYDVGEIEGTSYLAMELVEGKTLRELLASAEPIPMKRLLDIATQTADGLARAHASGIVHRDLKPENLMVSRDGFVKILDFGLAKLTEPISQDASGLPTVLPSATEPGTVMGTAGYMSPEQASGQPVDYRSDQFTLGAILYEMATGKRAFHRKTGAETLVAVIREEPEPLGQAAPKAPAPVRWIVERLMAKDPEERYASTKDLARELKSIRDHLTETSVSGGIEAAEPVRPRRRGWVAPAAAALVAGIAAGFFVHGLTSAKAGTPVVLTQITYARGGLAGARFAPDSRTIVYSAAWEGLPLDTFTTRAGSSESRSLGLLGAKVLAVSSTGELAVALKSHFLFGFESVGTLARVPLDGGAPREVLEDVESADWSPDGKNLAVARLIGNRSRLEYPIGKVLYEASGWVGDVRVSPEGSLVAFIDHPVRGDNIGTVKVLDTSGKPRLAGPFAISGVAWSPQGDEVWSSGRSVISATTLSGKTRRVWNAPGAFLKDLARDGRVLWALNASRREIVGYSAGEQAERNLTWLNWSFPKGISADGKIVLFEEENIQPQGIYLRKLDGSPAVRIGDGDAWGLSPDGKSALTKRDGVTSQFTLLPAGAGEPRPLPETGLICQAGAWFPDGRHILIMGREAGRGVRLFVQDISEGKPRAITPEGVSILFHTVSPDGRWIVATGPDRRIFLYPVEPGEPRPVPGLVPEDIPLRWTADGASLFVYRPSAPPLRVEKVNVKTGERTLWKEIRPPDPSGVQQVGPIEISPDEKSYVYSYRRVLDELYLATGLR